MTDPKALSTYLTRQHRLNALLLKNNIDALVLNPTPTLPFLTGLHFHLMERPIIAIFKPDYPIVFIIPQLESQKFAVVDDYPYIVFKYQEKPITWEIAFIDAFKHLGMNSKTVGIEPTGLRFLEYEFIGKAAKDIRLVSAAEIIAELRSIKSEDEIVAMRKAANIAQIALINTLPIVKPGITEKTIASELTVQLLRAGSEPQVPFFPIVSGGPNSANPHAVPSDRPIQEGDLLVIDWGARVNGYCSDITRTFAIGQVEEELKRIGKVVFQANQAARETVKPGVLASDIDLAARNVIRDAGYGQFFTHRTGHGLGLEGHEAPFIRDDNPLIMETGMTFTIEPGIYLPNRGGVRIEDDIVITERGHESLSDLPRELRTLPLSSE
ncbi:MAG: aminopeptidase P family protein [Anaerolineales bacterium]|nr:aminopeptidase P family protein [Anaerolineales bacterium]